MFGLVKAKEQQKSTGLALQEPQSVDIFQVFTGNIQRPNTRTENTQATGYNLEPGTIGTAVNANLDMEPKQVINRLSNTFPTKGMQPEQKAQMNLAAKLSGQAAEDAKFYTQKADVIAGNMAKVHTHQTEHKANMFKHDLTVKGADVKYMGAVQHWQTETIGLLNQAREKHAGIQLAASCL
jgi:hypothetical protein